MPERGPAAGRKTITLLRTYTSNMRTKQAWGDNTRLGFYKK
jgi:hypothetical protein